MPESVAHALRDYIAQVHRDRVDRLRLHAGMAVGVGAMILIFGGNRAMEETVGVWTRGALGWGALASGLMLAWAVRDYRDDEQRREVQRWAFHFLSTWHVFMAGSIVLSVALFVASDQPWVFTPWWEASPQPPQPVPFPFVIYLSIALGLNIHSRASRRRPMETR